MVRSAIQMLLSQSVKTSDRGPFGTHLHDGRESRQDICCHAAVSQVDAGNNVAIHDDPPLQVVPHLQTVQRTCDTDSLQACQCSKIAVGLWGTSQLAALLMCSSRQPPWTCTYHDASMQVLHDIEKEHRSCSDTGPLTQKCLALGTAKSIWCMTDTSGA